MNCKMKMKIVRWLTLLFAKTALLMVLGIVAPQTILATPTVSPPDSLHVIRLVTDSGTYYLRHEYLDRLTSESAEKGFNCDSIISIKNNKISLRDSIIIAKDVQLGAHQGIGNVLNDEVVMLNKDLNRSRRGNTILKVFSVSGWMTALTAATWIVVYLVP